MPKIKGTLIAATVGAIAAAGGVEAATVTNGSFESGFFGWSTIGATSIQTSAFGAGPTDGVQQALMTSAIGSTWDDTIESFLGLSTGSLDALSTGNATGGSSIKSVFDANAGDTISFDWNFLTDESTPSAFNDFGFVSVSVDGVELTLADTFSAFSPSPTDFAGETGFNSFNYTLLTGGTVTLGFGVMNTTDSNGYSALLIDNVAVSAIPLPPALWLFASALGVFGYLGKRKAAAQDAERGLSSDS